MTSGHVHHERAIGWLESIEEPQCVWFCRATQQSFLRLVTTAAVLAPHGSPPLTNDEAWNVYAALTADYRVAIRSEEPFGIDREFEALSRRRTASPKLWMDAYLAAFARAEGWQLVTTDAAFRQFDQLDVLVLG